MMISTRGRYALRVLADLAEHRSEGFVPMKGVAARQEISLKYMEKILPVLTKNHIVDGIQGKGGGYRLSRPPGGELSDAAGLERAGQTHQRVLRQRDAGRFGEKVKERPRRRRYCAAGAFCCV